MELRTTLPVPDGKGIPLLCGEFGGRGGGTHTMGTFAVGMEIAGHVLLAVDDRLTDGPSAYRDGSTKWITLDRPTIGIVWSGAEIAARHFQQALPQHLQAESAGFALMQQLATAGIHALYQMQTQGALLFQDLGTYFNVLAALYDEHHVPRLVRMGTGTAWLPAVGGWSWIGSQPNVEWFARRHYRYDLPWDMAGQIVAGMVWSTSRINQTVSPTAHVFHLDHQGLHQIPADQVQTWLADWQRWDQFPSASP